MGGLYDDFSDAGESPKIEIKQRTDLRKIYFDFLCDFKRYMAEFVRESLVELEIGEIPVSTNPVKLYYGEFGGMKLTLKNQGLISCWISTTGRGGFRLDPGEKESLWLNKEISAMTVSGNTCLGLIRT